MLSKRVALDETMLSVLRPRELEVTAYNGRGSFRAVSFVSPEARHIQDGLPPSHRSACHTLLMEHTRQSLQGLAVCHLLRPNACSCKALARRESGTDSSPLVVCICSTHIGGRVCSQHLRHHCHDAAFDIKRQKASGYRASLAGLLSQQAAHARHQVSHNLSVPVCHGQRQQEVPTEG